MREGEKQIGRMGRIGPLRRIPNYHCRIMRPSVFALPLLLLSLPLAVSAAWGADVEQALNARWRGGFVVVKLPVASSCNGRRSRCSAPMNGTLPFVLKTMWRTSIT